MNLVGYAPDATHKAADLYYWMGNGGADRGLEKHRLVPEAEPLHRWLSRDVLSHRALETRH